MGKYTVEFKCSLVEQYLSGSAGFKSISHRHGVNPSLLRKWVESFRLHGVAGLQKKFSHYDASFRLSVLQHMWENHLSYGQVAAVFNIRSPGCIGAWERSYHRGGLDALTPRTLGKNAKMPDPKITKPEPPPVDDEQRSREELLAEVQQLRMENAYLKKLKALVQAPHKKRK